MKKLIVVSLFSLFSALAYAGAGCCPALVETAAVKAEPAVMAASCCGTEAKATHAAVKSDSCCDAEATTTQAAASCSDKDCSASDCALRADAGCTDDCGEDCAKKA